MSEIKNCVSSTLTSRNLIGMASKHMEGYRLPDGEVDISFPDTGVIVLIILYLIHQEPDITRTKLECYLLLLDRKCFDAKGVTLFNWELKNGKIRNFKSFIDFMVKKGLIAVKGNNRFEVLEPGLSLRNNFAMLSNITFWIKEILSDWKGKTAKATSSVVSNTKLSSQYILALEHVRRIIKVHAGDSGN